MTLFFAFLFNIQSGDNSRSKSIRQIGLGTISYPWPFYPSTAEPPLVGYGIPQSCAPSKILPQWLNPVYCIDHRLDTSFIVQIGKQDLLPAIEN